MQLVAFKATPTPDIGIQWTDRRPIGQAILASSDDVTGSTGTVHGAPDGLHDTAYNNINGWTNGGPNRLDWGSGDLPTAEARLAAFQADIVSKFQALIQNTVNVHGQGIIVWDIAGVGKNSYITGMSNETYLGDPRFLDPICARLTGTSSSFYPYVNLASPLAQQGCAPEIDAIANKIFSMVSNAGLIPGICVRGEKVKMNTTSTGTITGTDDSYWYFMGSGANSSGENYYSTLSDQLADLDAKITYAYKRWGCRLFYVDSNAASQEFSSITTGDIAPAYLFTQLRARHPDCLFFPEHYFENATTGPGVNDPTYQYERAASRYTEMRSEGTTIPFLHAGELAAVPSAFTLIHLADSAILDGSGNVIGVEGNKDPSYDPAAQSELVSALQANQCLLMFGGLSQGDDYKLCLWLQQQAHVNGF